MSCCGKKREEIRKRRTTSVIPNPAPAPATVARTPVSFMGTGAYLVAGASSRQVYSFSSKEPEQLVDAKDVSTLLRTGLFQAKS